MTEPTPRHAQIAIEVVALAEAGRPDLLDEIVEVYAAAFRLPPWNEGPDQVAAFRTRLIDDAAHRVGGRLALTRRADGDLAGFATAWTTPSSFPTGRAYTAVAEALSASTVEQRLSGCSEIDELAVDPGAQGQGLGRHLIEAIAPPGTSAWLLTSSSATAALRLYRSLAWDELTPTDAPLAVFATPT